MALYQNKPLVSICISTYNSAIFLRESLDSILNQTYPRRKWDISKAKEEFGFEASTDIKDGFKQTIEWYENHKEEIGL